MWWSDYIREVQRQLVEVYGFTKREGGVEVVPAEGSVPDGYFPMEIEGKVDHVIVEGGRIRCMRDTPPEGLKPAQKESK